MQLHWQEFMPITTEQLYSQKISKLHPKNKTMENTEKSENKAVSNFKSISLKWGLIGAAVVIVYSLLMYVIDSSLMVNTWAGLLGIVVMLAVLVLGVKEVRTSQGGFISLSEALFTAFLVYVICSFLSNAFNYVLFNWIDTNLPVLLKEKAIETTVEMMQKFGGSEEDINKVLEQMDKDMDLASASTMLWNFLKGSAFGFVLSFIIALIMKRKRPIFE
jgi:Protein of unknown function (DUF4199)